jgi:membrane protein DedA with SNARE-associated domain
VEEFLTSWGYLGIFVGIVLTGLGLPMPEELPIVLGGALAGGYQVYWWIMLPVCIAGVILGDSCLYFIGRWYGPRLLEFGWVKRRLLPPERVQRIEKNFKDYGVRILLFARLTPGIRAPIFLTAGLTRLPLARFILADGIYAVPGVSLLFFLGYWFTDRMVAIVKKDVEMVKTIIILVVLLAVIGYLVYRFLRKPMVSGAPEEMPPLMEKMTGKLEQMTTKIIYPHKSAGDPPVSSPSNGQADSAAETDRAGPHP